MAKVLGIDLGGTKIKAVLYEFGCAPGGGADSDCCSEFGVGAGAPSGSEARCEFKILRLEKINTGAGRGLPVVYEDLLTLVKSFLHEGISAVGIGVPGPVPSNGIPLKMPNIPDSENFDIAGKLERDTKLPVSVTNDVNCFLIAEKVFGEGKNYKDLLGITMGTGIGGAIIINNELVKSRDGVAGEFGHMILDKQNNLSLENLCSGTAIARRFRETSGKSFCAREIHDMAINKNPDALEFYRQIGHDFGIGILNLILCFNPEFIVLGGATSRAFPFMEESMRKVLDEQGFEQSNKIKIVRTKISGAGTLGAAYLALRLPFSM